MTPSRFVRFLGCSDAQVSWQGDDDPRNCCIIGHTYDVLSVHVFDWHTTIRLAAFPDRRFNSVAFAEVPVPRGIVPCP